MWLDNDGLLSCTKLEITCMQTCSTCFVTGAIFSF